jgi:hypothetical protein
MASTKPARRRAPQKGRRTTVLGIRMEDDLIQYLEGLAGPRRVSKAQVARDIILDRKEGRLVPAT